MTRHPRLLAIPGCETHPADARRHEQHAAEMMATEAMAALPFDVLCDVIAAHITARPDADWQRQHDLAMALDRPAWRAMPAEAAR